MPGAGHAATDAAVDSDAVGRLRAAPFVRLVAHADGDGLAAAGLVAAALEAAGVPFQARLVRTAAAGRRAGSPRGDADDAARVAVGVPGPEDAVAVGTDDRPASERAYELAAALGADPDPVLALAGVAAAGEPPTAAGVAHAAAEERGLVERRPGVAVPTAARADGVAHTTLAHCGFSGDADAALSAVADPDDPRAVASLVALSATDGPAPPRAATAVERALRPLATPDGPFATVGGYGDVLAVLSRTRPGLGLAVALGRGRTDAALAAWRDRARAAHGALAAADVEHRGDVAAVRADDAPAWTVSRLLRDFRTEAPVAAAVRDGAVAVAGTADVDVPAAVSAAAEAVAADAAAVRRRGFARTDDAAAFLAALREVV